MCGRFYIKGISRDAEEHFQKLFGIDIPPPDQDIIPAGKGTFSQLCQSGVVSGYV